MFFAQVKVWPFNNIGAFKNTVQVKHDQPAALVDHIYNSNIRYIVIPENVNISMIAISVK